jgi:hypothetical protein
MRHQHEQARRAAARAARAQSPAPPPQRLAADSYENALDDAIAASFPASDPPSWTTGTASVAAASSAS